MVSVGMAATPIIEGAKIGTIQMPKPAVSDFFVRGYPLEDALAILERWDSLTEPERALARQHWRRLTVRQRLSLNPCYEGPCLPAAYH